MFLYGDEEVKSFKSSQTTSWVSLPKEGEKLQIIPLAFYNKEKTQTPEIKSKLEELGLNPVEMTITALPMLQLFMDATDYNKKVDNGEIDKEIVGSPVVKLPSIMDDEHVDPACYLNNYNEHKEVWDGLKVTSTAKFKNKNGNPHGASFKLQYYMPCLFKNDKGEWEQGILNFHQSTLFKALGNVDNSDDEDKYGIFGKTLSITYSNRQYSVTGVFTSVPKTIEDVVQEGYNLKPAFLFIPVFTREEQVKVLNEIGLELPEVPENKKGKLESYNKQVEELRKRKNEFKDNFEEDEEWQEA